MRRALLTALLLAACTTPEPEDDDVLSVEPASIDLDEKADTTDPGGNVEVKVTLRSDQVAAAVKAFKLKSGSASSRDVWFYDTAGLELYGRGVLLRSRKVKDAPDDSTVKLRPLAPSEVAPSRFAQAGFKCESDRTGTKTVPSCSLTVKQDQGEIDDVAEGKRTVDKLFSPEQEAFAARGGDVPWADLTALGPVQASVWKVKVKGLSAHVTFEQWVIPGGPTVLEASMRVPANGADAAAAELAALLVRKGFDASSTQETKTQAAFSALGP